VRAYAQLACERVYRETGWCPVCRLEVHSRGCVLRGTVTEGDEVEHDYTATPTEAGWYWYYCRGVGTPSHIDEHGNTYDEDAYCFPAELEPGLWGPRLVEPVAPVEVTP
jgi:hypothetical protein